MEKEEILNKVEKYVRSLCEGDNTGHDFWHIKRVLNNANLIIEKEEADPFIVKMIALMHDIYDHKFYQGDVRNKFIVTFEELEIRDMLTKEEKENIIYSCMNLGFSSNYEKRQELSVEGKIVQDADRLDAIGAIGIARTFAYGGSKNRALYDPENVVKEKTKEEYVQKGSGNSIEHFYEKLLKLKNLMNTSTAKQIAKKRHEYLEGFLDEFLAEWDGKR